MITGILGHKLSEKLKATMMIIGFIRGWGTNDVLMIDE